MLISLALYLNVGKIFQCVGDPVRQRGFVPRQSKINYDNLAEGSLTELRHVFARVVFDTVYPLNLDQPSSGDGEKDGQEWSRGLAGPTHHQIKGPRGVSARTLISGGCEDDRPWISQCLADLLSRRPGILISRSYREGLIILERIFFFFFQKCVKMVWFSRATWGRNRCFLSINEVLWHLLPLLLLPLKLSYCLPPAIARASICRADADSGHTAQDQWRGWRYENLQNFPLSARIPYILMEIIDHGLLINPPD